MRITIILGPFYPVPTVLGGAVEKVHLQLAAAYVRAGHRVTMLSRRYGDFANDEMLEGVRHLRIPSSDRGASLLANLALDLPYAIRAARAMPESDTTVTNSFFLPMVLSRRKAGKIYVHVARHPKRQHFLYARADRLQTVSHSVAEAIVRQKPSLASKVRVIGNPVPERYFASHDKPTKDKIILYVGRIAREKELALLIRAFRDADESEQANNWTLRLIGPHDIAQGGDGEDYLNELKQHAAPLGGRCEFVGPIFDEKQLIENYRNASIFVYPTGAAQGEALPLAPLEAMANGCAVIVSALDCFRDYAENGRNAFVFDHRGANAQGNLTHALTQLMNDDTLRSTLGDRAMLTARLFGTDAIAAKMLADFQSLLSGPTH